MLLYKNNEYKRCQQCHNVFHGLRFLESLFRGFCGGLPKMQYFNILFLVYRFIITITRQFLYFQKASFPY